MPYRCLSKITPPEKSTFGKISFQGNKLGVGEQWLLPGCMAKAGEKGLFLFTDNGMLFVLFELIQPIQKDIIQGISS